MLITYDQGDLQVIADIPKPLDRNDFFTVVRVINDHPLINGVPVTDATLPRAVDAYLPDGRIISITSDGRAFIAADNASVPREMFAPDF